VIWKSCYTFLGIFPALLHKLIKLSSTTREPPVVEQYVLSLEERWKSRVDRSIKTRPADALI
jgi:hypothetical protein